MLSLGVPDIHLILLRPELEGFIVPSKLMVSPLPAEALSRSAPLTAKSARVVRHHDCGFVVEPVQTRLFAETLLRLRTDHARIAEIGRRARAMLDTYFTRRHAFERRRTLVDQISLTSQGRIAERDAIFV